MLFSRAARRSLKNPVILNRYNIASYLAEDKEAKNYWNIDNLIQQTITTAEDVEEYNIRKQKKVKSRQQSHSKTYHKLF
ncbi:hypothetical protein SDC49_11690 [Lactobacillus sp. R2/2]|nr:hypothetical protein [Lactobacillus sp. R2/2]